MKKKTVEEYEAAGARLGLTLAGALPKNVNTNTDWKCRRCGRSVKYRLSNMIRPHANGCPSCDGYRTRDEEDYAAMGARHGFTLVKMAGNVREMSIWKDAVGDEFEVSYEGLRRRELKNGKCDGSCYECKNGSTEMVETKGGEDEESELVVTIAE